MYWSSDPARLRRAGRAGPAPCPGRGAEGTPLAGAGASAGARRALEGAAGAEMPPAVRDPGAGCRSGARARAGRPSGTSASDSPSAGDHAFHAQRAQRALCRRGAAGAACPARREAAPSGGVRPGAARVSCSSSTCSCTALSASSGWRARVRSRRSPSSSRLQLADFLFSACSRAFSSTAGARPRYSPAAGSTRRALCALCARLLRRWRAPGGSGRAGGGSRPADPRPADRSGFSISARLSMICGEQAQPLGDQQGVRAPRQADGQVVGGAQRFEVELHRSVDHARGGVGEGF